MIWLSEFFKEYTYIQHMQGSEKPGFLKKAQPTVFLGFYWVLGFIRFFGFFYMYEQLGSLLIDLARQLSFYLDSLLL